MALKKSDLYSSLWKSCDELRGGMDASGRTVRVLHLAELLDERLRAKFPLVAR